ncbi:DNA-binding protein Alba [Candidatus Micrarchaeota archaeon CG10_big_fil_rev_8_21_14_0_10_45_29]|nr:MAG: DNA-binding protein Alba [Candidatus Micrarchaeota archaeon CG10_big_fil_rev_8_21_14_0_10_45_29]
MSDEQTATQQEKINEATEQATSKEEISQEAPVEKAQEAPAEQPQEASPTEEDAPAEPQEAPAGQAEAISQAPPAKAQEPKAFAPRPQQARSPRDENTIFIGRKSTMGYVLAVVTQFNSGAKEVKIKARGKLISKAVDVAEIAKGRFLPGAKSDAISITTEEVQNEDGSKSKVSSIEIKMQK